MIRISRGPEPPELPAERQRQLLTVSATKPARTDGHRTGYTAFKTVLAERQRKKCCYCERIVTASYNDVEHFRPFSRYWWLAWTWENLLFACAPCNRSGKNDAFPLASGSAALQFGDAPPGTEQPLLLDPAVDDPRLSIRFLLVNGRWIPVGLDERGRETLRLLNFDDEYTDRVQRRVRDVMGWVAQARDAIHSEPHNQDRVGRVWESMVSHVLNEDQEFHALTEDVLTHEFPTFPKPPVPTTLVLGADSSNSR